MRTSSTIALLVASILPAALAAGNGIDRALAQAANPCAPKAAANPCAPKAAANPCAGNAQVDPKLILRPKGTRLLAGDRAQLIKEGKTLWEDTKLSTNGMSCVSCHTDNENFAPTFAKSYPHKVAMPAEKSGVSQVQLDEMIQFCMVVPMAAKALPWSSRELAALAAYSGELQSAFRKQGAKPAAASSKGANPCAPKAANPCAPKAANPCAPKH